MARRSRIESLETAWRALAGVNGGEGWRTIPIELHARCQVLAARRFPGNEETVLVGFKSVRMPTEAHMPRGKGFVVAGVQLARPGDELVWLSLARQSAASIELFGMMAGDVIDVLDSQSDRSDSELLGLFLARIKAWQDFMERSGVGVLNAEAEVGLVGELVLLGSLLQSGVAADYAVKAWEGPMGGLHDFALNQGAIEVKSTVASTDFPAVIFSLEQLDHTITQPLFLAGVRLKQEPCGKTLPALVADLREALSAESAALLMFQNRLVQAGYLDAFAESYSRTFSHVSTRIMQVDEKLPVLTRHNVGRAVRKARYEIDIDLLSSPDVALVAALQKLGVNHGIG